MKVLLLLFCPLLLLGQENCTGFVVDKRTGARIPYATVGLMRENKGVSADGQGVFSIHVAFPKGDSLRISSVGYQTLVLPAAAWANGRGVALLQKESSLQEVVIASNRRKQVYTLNEFRQCSSNWYRIGLEAVYQLAQRFEAPEQGMQLSELELCKDASACIFRVRVYEVDSISGGPSKDIADTVIEVRSRESHVRINLESYAIRIPGKSFFVAIEWLFIPFNEAQEKVKRQGKKMDWTYYKPAIRFVYDRKAKGGKVWTLGFNGRWYSWLGTQDHNFQLTAKLR